MKRFRASYGFWNIVRLEVTTSRAALHHSFERTFRSFAMDEGSRLDMELRVDADTLESLYLDDSDAITHVQNQVVMSLARALRGRFLFFHAAALTSADGAHVFLGRSMSGKTTLAVAGMRAGYRLLSDEIVPIDIERKLVHPFPLPLKLRSFSREWVRRFHPPVGEVLDASAPEDPCGPDCHDPAAAHVGWLPSELPVALQREPAPLAAFHLIGDGEAHPVLELMCSCLMTESRSMGEHAADVSALAASVPVRFMKRIALHDPLLREESSERLCSLHLPVR